MSTTHYQEKTIGELVAEDIRKADVFKKYGIDFCCGGKEKVKDVCSRQGIDSKKLEQELFLAEQKKTGAEKQNFIEWEPDALIEHIINVHHYYVRETIPFIFEYNEKVSKVHGDQNPEVKEILFLFREAANELGHHMVKEERILFPYIQQLAAAQKNQSAPPLPHFGTVQNPIRMMEAEHEAVGELFQKIFELSKGFSPPEHACNTYRALYSKLLEFRDDLHQHIHLENNILFPKAIKLEALLFPQS